jgi:hypothetical protein
MRLEVLRWHLNADTMQPAPSAGETSIRNGAEATDLERAAEETIDAYRSSRQTDNELSGLKSEVSELCSRAETVRREELGQESGALWRGIVRLLEKMR